MYFAFSLKNVAFELNQLINKKHVHIFSTLKFCNQQRKNMLKRKGQTGYLNINVVCIILVDFQITILSTSRDASDKTVPMHRLVCPFVVSIEM